jgi:hypothetical protein
MKTKIIQSSQITKGLCPNGHSFCFNARCWTESAKLNTEVTVLHKKRPRSKRKAR